MILWTWAIVFVSAGLARADGPNADLRAQGKHVLVIYAGDDADRDASGRPDSAEAAEYYARRRGVPEENLLPLTLQRARERTDHCTYREFFEKVLTPVAAKLAAKAPDGETFARRVCYLLLAPGVPVSMTTHPAAGQGEQSWARKQTRRSVDSYLISAAANEAAGVDEKTGFPGAGLAGPLGSDFREVVLPLFAAYADPAKGKHFRQFQRDDPQRFSFHLVTRLGLDLDSARDMLDGALYAQRYLRLPGKDEGGAFRPRIWLDQKYQFAEDHVAAMARTVALVQGLPGSPFSAGQGLRSPWPLVIDNQIMEIGAVVKKTVTPATASAASGASTAPATGAPATAPASQPAEFIQVQHRPTVTSRIVGDGVDAKGVRLVSPARIGRRGTDAPPALYFPPGSRVTNGKVWATVTGADAGENRLLLDRTEGFAPGDTITYTWAGEFPTRDCFIFYGFYGLGRYEDVFQFPPGAVGIHVDSSCMNWAKGAIGRGIAATFGVTGEPLSAGIPYGDQVLLALAGGYDWAEAAYGGLRLAQRWTGVVFGDPLYAPFRSEQRVDRTPPVLTAPVVRVAGGAVTITAALGGQTPDELADVALFRLEYGPTDRYGQAVDFLDWPEPQDSAQVRGRRFGYSRHFRWTLKDLRKGATYHFRLTARDPAGLETSTPDATFKP